MRVILVANRGEGTTGLSRYSETLRNHLLAESVDLEVARPIMPLPGPLSALGRRLGWDLRTFFDSYPLWSKLPDGEIYHLTTENLASLLTLRHPRPIVVTVHAFFSYFLRHDPELQMYGHAFHRWFDALVARGLGRATKLIAVSNYVKELLITRLGIAEERIQVIHEAVDHDFFYPRPESDGFRRKFGLEDDRFNILYVGSEQPRKNFLMLLRAFARLKEEFDHLRLLKVGQAELPPEREKALKLIEKLGISGDVQFLGHVGEALPSIYSSSDLFVFPSHYEGFGFPPLEAMACGLPTVCSNTSSLPEVVGDAALTFDPIDEDGLVEHCATMIQNDDLRNVYRERGLARAAEFSWYETARQTRALYEEVALQQE